jgi:hypothetical protein
MREMMRGTDRAMANIQNLPGGYSALRYPLFVYYTEPLNLIHTTAALLLCSQAYVPRCAGANDGRHVWNVQ